MAYCKGCPNKNACKAAGKCAKTGKKLTVNMMAGGTAKKKPAVKKAYGGMAKKTKMAMGGAMGQKASTSRAGGMPQRQSQRKAPQSVQSMTAVAQKRNKRK